MEIFVEVNSNNIITEASEKRFKDSNKEISAKIDVEHIVGSEYRDNTIKINTTRTEYYIDIEAKRRIQTIPADTRSHVLGRKKENPKTYTDTWQNFYQRCQNIRFDQDVMHELQSRKSATWVVKRIDKLIKNRDELKKKLGTLSVKEFEELDITDDALWQESNTIV